MKNVSLALLAVFGSCAPDLVPPQPRQPPEAPGFKPANPNLDHVALPLAAEAGLPSVVERIHAQHATLDWQKRGARALRIAAEHGSLEVIEPLLQYAACLGHPDDCQHARKEMDSDADDESAVRR